MIATAGELAISDRDLLDRFAKDRDELAFGQLVQRHGPLVMGVCRRVLRNTHEAEEAFQAVFLVLARKAGSLAWQTSITSWMYSVAYRTALKHRTALARRRRVEAKAVTAATIAAEPNPLQELSELIDAEMARLPEALRAPLLLCHLQGLSRAEAAEQLGVTVGAIKDRLERGRELLRRRLTRRGVTLSAALLGPLVVNGSASAVVPAALASATSLGATAFVAETVSAGSVSAPILALAEGVLRPMFLEKFKLAGAFLISLLTLGTAASIMLADTPDRFASGIRGEVVAIDTGKTPGNVTIRLDELDALVNFDVKSDAHVAFAYQKATLADLEKGTFVAIKLGDDHRTVVEIQARGHVSRGQVEAIDPAQRQVTLLVDHDDEEDTEPQSQTFSMAADAQARIDERAGLVADIEPGMAVKLEFARDKSIVTGVEGQWTRPDDLQGEVRAVDATQEVLTVVTELDDNDVEVALPLVRGGKVVINGMPGNLADLHRGARVTLRLSADRKAVQALRAIQRPSPEDSDDD